MTTNLFTFDWDAEVPDEVRDRLFARIVRAVRRWRLEMPAALFLEIHAPLSHLAGQGAIVFSPFLAPLFPDGLADVQRISKLLQRPENIRLLVDRIAEQDVTEKDTDAARQR